MAEVVVALRAEDQMSEGAMKAAFSLKNLQDQMVLLQRQAGGVVAASGPARAQIAAVGQASMDSVVPHRAANTALNLVTRQLAEVAGTAPMAHGALRILDEIMFQVALTGGAVSMAFIGITAAAVAISTIMAVSSASTKKQREELEGLTKATTAHVAAMNTLDPLAKRFQSYMGADIQREIISTKDQINTLNQSIEEHKNKILESGTRRLTDDVREFGAGIGAAVNVSRMFTTSIADTTREMQKEEMQITALQMKLRGLEEDARRIREKAVPYTPMVGDPKILTNYINQLERGASSMERFGAIVGARSVDFGRMNKWVEDSGKTIGDYVAQWDKASSAIAGAVVGMVEMVGEAMGNMIATGTTQWSKLLLSMVKMAVDALRQIAAMWLAASIMVSLGIGPQGIAASAALLAATSIASAFLGAMIAKTGTLGGTAAGATGAAGAAASATAAGPGGAPVATAQQQVVNNIVVNLPVQALDLASISDITLKSFAFRVGKVIREAAATGQFSLAGA